MKIETKYELGQTVWVVQSGRPGDRTCPGCLGRGRVTVKETGLRQRCGRCFAKGTEPDWSSATIWPRQGVVAKIEICCEAGYPVRERYKVEWERDGFHESAQEFVDAVYPSREAAQVAADKQIAESNKAADMAASGATKHAPVRPR